MSHNIGRIIPIGTPIGIGPDFASNSVNFQHDPDPVEATRFLILHFSNASFPASNRLEVNLGYDTDVFNSSSGSDFWTRPINLSAFSDGRVPINYITDGSSSGGVRLIGYGRAQRLGEGLRPETFTNCDLFLLDLVSDKYIEPDYDPFWLCDPLPTPNWTNYDCLPGGSDIRRQVGKSACMLITAHGNYLSTCSATLIGTDLVFSAGHCFSISPSSSPLDSVAAASASVAFDYQTNCDGSPPSGYAPKLFKVIDVVEYGYDIGKDYVILRIDVSGGDTGVTPLSLRTDLPSVGEEVFGVHHPNGAIKKFSPSETNYLNVLARSSTGITVNLDVAGGSSGSGLYDKFGNVIGTLSNGQCNLSYYPTATMLQDIASIPPAVSVPRDVLIVMDRSGSMSGTTYTGDVKIEEAKDAASLFVNMVRQEEGHKIGLVTFSNSVSKDFDLLPNNDSNVEDLVGPAPYSSGIVGGIIPGGSTSIGGGLDLAIDQFSGDSSRDEVILLLTDGMENTPPMIDEIDHRIGDRRLCIVGYGNETNLNGPILASLAILNDGSYTVAQDELSLKKFFASCFGEIFDEPFSMDPEFFLPKDVTSAKPMSFPVCGEETITIVLGWDTKDSSLLFNVIAPDGSPVNFSHADVVVRAGRTWRFARIKLPHNGQQDGQWKVNVFRPSGGEFPPPSIDIRYFVNVVAKGGPSLKRIPNPKRFYTGDTINPLVRLSYPTGTSPANGHTKVTITKPTESTGNILAKSGLDNPVNNAGDTLSPIYSTLTKMASESGTPLITYQKETFELFDDGAHDDGAMEEDGIFGNPLPDLLKHEGVHTFHAQTTFGLDCEASREVVWSVYVATKVDEGNTDVSSIFVDDTPSGKQKWKFIVTPKDKYGNFVGPGKSDSLKFTGAAGSTVIGGAKDNDDGSYGVEVEFDPSIGDDPGIVVSQPDTTPSVFCKQDNRSKFPSWVWFLLFILIVILCLLVFN